MKTSAFDLLRSPQALSYRNFARSENGAMAPMMLGFFCMMILLGGIAVDVMRFETKRVAVQNTLDRAVLGVANMNSALVINDIYTTPQARAEHLVADYFNKSGLGPNLVDVRLDNELSYRTVSARANAVTNTIFMNLMNIPRLGAVNSSTASQSVSAVEIALVLDVSGSMFNDFTRISNLKIAASDFVDTVLEDDPHERVSISLVPYNGQVNLGPELMSYFNVYDQHSFPNSYCIDLPTDTYSTTGLSTELELPQTPFADSWSNTGSTGSYSTPPTPQYNAARGVYPNVWCNPISGNYVQVHNNDAQQIKDQIDDMVAIGATSIDVGMKWGAVLLDPETRPIIASLAGNGIVPEVFSERPGDFTTGETMKVIVLMTDGENFEQERFNDGYRAGPSPVWRGNDRYSIFHRSRLSGNATARCNPFYVPHLDRWHPRPWNGTTPPTNLCYSATAPVVNAVNLTWPNLWANVQVQWVARHLYQRALGGTLNDYVSTFRSITPISEMNDRLQSICDAVKSRGVLVYSIAFEAPAGGQEVLRDCASQPLSNFYYYATSDGRGVNIRSAFAHIAANLTQLRLTQ